MNIIYGIIASVISTIVLITLIMGPLMLMTPNEPPKSVDVPSPFSSPPPQKIDDIKYPWHLNIISTIFWVGESATSQNDFIHNRSSAWVEDWVGSFGGIDDPNKRCGHSPCDFTPNENVFYFALPYNDFDEQGNRKANAVRIPWHQTPYPEDKSLVKNRWIEVQKESIKVYAQWEDVGPYGEDDVDYVFGLQPPKEKRAGLDLSPAAADFIKLEGKAQVKWRFVDSDEVPAGPWKQKVTQ